LVSALVSPLVKGIWYPTIRIYIEEARMETLNYLWTRFGTPRNRKVAYVVLSLVALAVASGAPGAGSGLGGGGLTSFFIGW
jgi:hypothetical protein